MTTNTIKTDDWVSTKELQSHIKNYQQEKAVVHKILGWYLVNQPDIVTYKFDKKHRKLLCIRRDFIPEFCKRSGFEHISKTKDWLNIEELTECLPYQQQDIYETLYRLQDDMPDDIQYRKESGRMVLCLNIKCLNTFRQVMLQAEQQNNNPVWTTIKTLYSTDTSKHMLSNNAPDKKTVRQWMPISTFTTLFKTGRTAKTCKQMKKIIVNIYKKQKHNNIVRRQAETRYLFNMEFVDWFCKTYDMELLHPEILNKYPCQHSIDKTKTRRSKSTADEWINLSTLHNLVILPTTQRSLLRNYIVDLFKTPGYEGKWVKQVQKTNSLYLFNKKYLKDFCVMYHLNLRDKPDTQTKHFNPSVYDEQLHKIIQTIEQDRDNWVKASALTSFIVNGNDRRDDIKKALLDLLKHAERRQWLHVNRKTHCKFNTKYLKQFCELYGFEIRGVLTPDTKWIQATSLMDLFSVKTQDSNDKITVAQALKDLYDKGTHPDWICKISETRFYLDTQHIEEFAEMYNFHIVSREKRTDQWMTPCAVRKIVTNTQISTADIVKLLKQHKDSHPDWIRHIGYALCLNRDYLPDFFDLIGLTYDLTKEFSWIGATKLSKKCNVPVEVISKILQEHKDEYPDIIQNRKLHVYSCLCFRVDRIQLLKNWCYEYVQQNKNAVLQNLVKETIVKSK